MFEILDRRTSLTRNQIKILAAAIIGDALEFFDYFLIGFVLAFLIGPWKLTFGSPHGSDELWYRRPSLAPMFGAGSPTVSADARCLSERAELLHRHRPSVFHAGQWLDLSLSHAFLRRARRRRSLIAWTCPWYRSSCPPPKRGWVGGLVTCVIPLGVGLGAVIGALVGSGEWRLLFAVGVLPALLVLLVRMWVPESPRWLCRQGRYEEARKSLAWRCRCSHRRCRCRPRPTLARSSRATGSTSSISTQPDRLLVRQCRSTDRCLRHHALGTIAIRAAVKGHSTGAAKMMILLSVSGFIGRLSFSYFSELMGRRNAGGRWDSGPGS